MASAYVIGSYDIVDPDGYDGYVPGVLERLAAHGAEVIVADFDAHALAGCGKTTSADATWVFMELPSGI